jgi:hypothetical protein
LRSLSAALYLHPDKLQMSGPAAFMQDFLAVAGGGPIVGAVAPVAGGRGGPDEIDAPRHVFQGPGVVVLKQVSCDCVSRPLNRQSVPQMLPQYGQWLCGHGAACGDVRDRQSSANGFDPQIL